MDNTDEKIIRDVFEKMKDGLTPRFGSPEIKCSKCMFLGVICQPSTEYAGCYGGWKMEKE